MYIYIRLAPFVLVPYRRTSSEQRCRFVLSLRARLWERGELDEGVLGLEPRFRLWADHHSRRAQPGLRPAVSLMAGLVPNFVGFASLGFLFRYIVHAGPASSYRKPNWDHACQAVLILF